jgi:hypothetical protein
MVIGVLATPTIAQNGREATGRNERQDIKVNGMG